MSFMDMLDCSDRFGRPCDDIIFVAQPCHTKAQSMVPLAALPDPTLIPAFAHAFDQYPPYGSSFSVEDNLPPCLLCRPRHLPG